MMNAMMSPTMTGMPGMMTPGMTTMPGGMPAMTMPMVPRCTIKMEKTTGGMKITCVCQDKMAASTLQNLCAAMAGTSTSTVGSAFPGGPTTIAWQSAG